MITQFPIFVLAKDCDEVAAYNSFEELEKNLEPIDIENKEYEAWDAQGFRLNLLTQKPTWLKIEGLHPDFEALKNAVLKHAKLCDVEIGSPVASVDDLNKIVQSLNERKAQSGLLSKFFKKAKT